MALSVLVDLILHHYLFGDIIRNQSLSGALCSELSQIVELSVLSGIILFKNINKLGECGCDPDTLLILNALVTLLEHFFYDKRKIFLFLLASCLVEIHKHSNERCLSVGGHKGYDLILNHLHTVLYFFAESLFGYLFDVFLSCVQILKLFRNLLADLLTAHIHKGSKMGERNALSAVLA